MGKNILLATLLLVSVFFGFISNSRSKEAKRQAETAQANLELAEAMTKKALEEARTATEKAEKTLLLLKECQNK
ncbi:hypothetical protein KO507_08765 [Gilvimarinus agarilyticus]|uniref:Uncharacterized protein n=1 Tax=Reichenbachiella agariperforans TaxID=156994 RepID=A0A1M6W1S5_REIAG|nr:MULTISPECIES: hypothetical protein [Reichenbachiella]MBU2885851.1 hypothetical protein [Gilvimarinus agarilyticus]MBU2915234.1 hypothetical protein [Reichenbachiella agariperforans]RJE70897.1 hypothetical protein BGP76_08930 [Reichenbachiella sp. MSK19-1]SHK87694.1 hypothetical protein SAMN04488028_11090 [Reichenbachiella agariperforans]